MSSGHRKQLHRHLEVSDRPAGGLGEPGSETGAGGAIVFGKINYFCQGPLFAEEPRSEVGTLPELNIGIRTGKKVFFCLLSLPYRK